VSDLPRDVLLRRRRSLRLHIIWAMGVLALLILSNAIFSPRYPWWLWVLMLWMPLIAIHTAWAMGLIRWPDAREPTR
jgi:hypothetical protein